ncbi:MAG: hypothetical protein ACR2RB_10195, partial [Gammaproteobacteria bacterium]
LSVSVPGLPKVKWIVRTFAQAHARELFERAMEFEDPVEIRTLLNDALVEAGLGGLVRAGKH